MLIISSAAKSMSHVSRNVRAHARLVLNKQLQAARERRPCNQCYGKYLVLNPSDGRTVREGQVLGISTRSHLLRAQSLQSCRRDSSPENRCEDSSTLPRR